MPSGTQDRIDRAEEIIELAYGKGLAGERPLRGPAGHPHRRRPHDRPGLPRRGVHHPAAFRRSEIHITGGISNISFGLPARRIISDVFLDLCVQAGHDSGIVDPVADLQAALNPDRESDAYRLAAAMLTGEDAFGMEFIEAFRAGRLS